MKSSIVNISLNSAAKRSVQAALMTALIASGLSLSACSSKDKAETDSDEVMAVDRVNEAEDIAQANAPEAEELSFENNAGVGSADTAEAEGDTATDGAETSEVKSADGEAKANGMDDAKEASAGDMSTGDATETDPNAATANNSEAQPAPTSK